MNIIEWIFKMKKKIIKHLKGDIKGYKHEIKEDRELIKDLKKSSKKPAGNKERK